MNEELPIAIYGNDGNVFELEKTKTEFDTLLKELLSVPQSKKETTNRKETRKIFRSFCRILSVHAQEKKELYS